MVQLKTSHLSITSSWTMKFQVGWLANCDWKNISLWERMTHGSWNRNFLRQTARKTIQSLIKHSKCPFDQKNLWRFTCGYELPYWNLWCWQVQHLRWNWKTPSSRYFTSIFQKIIKYSNVLYLWYYLALFAMWCLEMGNVQSHIKWPYTKVSSKY